MNEERRGFVVSGNWIVRAAPAFAAIVWFTAAGCEQPPPVDKRFAAQTYDEYTEPLTNAIIGSPSGVTVISPDGVAAQVAEGALTTAAPAASKDGGVIISGAGGSSTSGSADGGVPPVDH